MRERALLVGGTLQIGRRPEGGTAVQLRLPARVPS
jgi:signal transduction histidine kinase